MHPAFSVIVFSTLSGAGYGLLALIALALLGEAAPVRALLWLLALALVLVTVGLLSSLGHLGKPLRAWRAFSQWRTSWLSREGVAAVATYPPALVVGAALLVQTMGPDAAMPVSRGSGWSVAAAVLVVIGAVATVVCTAMIYASLKPIPAWRHRLVLPGYLVFALLGGAGAMAAAVALTGAEARGWAGLFALAAVAAAAMKLRYWHELDTTDIAFTRGDAVGLPTREVSVFERPHTQGNYLTREMGFVLARRHAARLRVIALVLFGAAPLVAVVTAWWLPPLAALTLPAAALASLLGILVERWLFFAQARHMVTLYY